MKGHSSGGDLPESQCWLVALVGQPSVLESGPNRPKMDKIRQLPDRARPVPLLCSLISSPWFPSKAKLMFHRLTEKVFVLKKNQNDDFLKIVKSEVDSNEEISPGKGLSPCLHAVKDQFAKSQREEGESSLAFTRGADRRDPQPYTRRSCGSVHHANHAFLTFLPVRPPTLHFLEHLCHPEAWGILYDVPWRLTCNRVMSVATGGKFNRKHPLF